MIEKKLVYVIDDDLGTRLLISKMVEKGGYKCITFESGRKCLAKLNETTEYPDLILLDSMLKDEMGIDVLIELKSKEQYAFISVIMITGAQQIDVIKNAYLVGVSDYLLKPVQNDILLQRIKENLTIKIDESNVYQIIERMHIENPELLNAIGLKEYAKNKRCFPITFEGAALAVLIPSENRPKSFLNYSFADLKIRLKVFRNVKVRWSQIWPWLGTSAVLDTEIEHAKQVEMHHVQDKIKTDVMKRLSAMTHEYEKIIFSEVSEQLMDTDMPDHLFEPHYEIKTDIMKTILRWSDNAELALKEAEIWKDKFPLLDFSKKGEQK